MDECLLNAHSCHGNAACTNTFGSYTCRCLSGYSGDGRAQCVDVDECQPALMTCMANASCTNTIGSFQCNCYTGKLHTAQGHSAGGGGDLGSHCLGTKFKSGPGLGLQFMCMVMYTQLHVMLM